VKAMSLTNTSSNINGAATYLGTSMQMETLSIQLRMQLTLLQQQAAIPLPIQLIMVEDVAQLLFNW